MLEPVSYSPVGREERGEVQRENVPKGCCVVALINTLAVVTIGTLGLVYWTVCMMEAPRNVWYNVNTNDWGQPIQNKTYWCEHLNNYGYHQNNLTRCVEALQNAEKAQAQCWDVGGRVSGLMTLAIFTCAVVINNVYFCAKKVSVSY